MEEITMANAQELFNKYDAIINITMVNLYSLSKGKREIILSNIDRKNRDHLFILRVALLAKDIYNFPLKLETDFWNWLVLNWRMRKLSRRVPRVKDSGTLIDVQNLIDFMYVTFKETIDENFEFAHIYNQFYKGELD
jgi:hypothetical protein